MYRTKFKGFIGTRRKRQNVPFLHQFYITKSTMSWNIIHIANYQIIQSMTLTLHALQKYLMQHIRDQFPFTTKAMYFTGSCAGQYKNYNFFWTCGFMKMTLEWKPNRYSLPRTLENPLLFVGIGGTIKYQLDCASLQRSHMLIRFCQLV